MLHCASVDIINVCLKLRPSTSIYNRQTFKKKNIITTFKQMQQTLCSENISPEKVSFRL